MNNNNLDPSLSVATGTLPPFFCLCLANQKFSSTMFLNPKSFLVLSPFLLLLLRLSSATVSTASSSIQSLLKSRGLPPGIFPSNVNSYSLDDQSGHLEVHLEGPCMAKFGTRVYFDTVVRANLSYGGLVGLEGLTQEELFLWLPVKGIIVCDPSSGLILFDIGLAHKELSLSLFEDPPVCKSQGAVSENVGRIRKMGFEDQR
ncbi:hypothetical protein K2173_004561 [Erythroxylum novogranatense]|uniref:Uncharacterized protein n=1 Tax=Erythroxylum novogranatense TaxID=1862640 RepID=A0AAV8T4Q8_9ROSI|nr:hypothetical protein K2173_004561 [Erythroxylum novogranatense]